MKTVKTSLKLILLIFILSSLKAAAANSKLISTEVKGSGSPMILIHGMSCSAAVWDEFVERYSGNYELHLVHIKGFGNKEMMASDHYLKQIRDELIGYVGENKLKSPILIGHSMGGFIGLWAAAEATDIFGKIVSIDGVPYFPVLQMPGISPETAKPMVNSMKAQFESVDEKAARANQEMIVSTMIATEDKRNEVVEMGMASNPKVVGQAFGEMFLTDIRGEMSNIQVPVLVFGSWAAYENYGATKDSVTEGYQSQLKDIKDVKLLVANEAYHFVFYDEPDWFYNELEKFLEE